MHSKYLVLDSTYKIILPRGVYKKMYWNTCKRNGSNQINHDYVDEITYFATFIHARLVFNKIVAVKYLCTIYFSFNLNTV